MYSGKTYTVSGTAHDPGIVPIAVNELFHLITERRSTEAFKVSLGYLEIYNERIYDLCSPSLNGQDGKDSGGKSSSSGKDNSKDSGEFWQQYLYLIREQFRVMKPGRIVAIHCMNLPTKIGRAHV